MVVVEDHCGGQNPWLIHLFLAIKQILIDRGHQAKDLLRRTI